MKRSPRRWRTTFGAWVAATSVTALREKLHSAGHPITERAVYEWLSGRKVPRLPVAVAIVKISGGAVRVEDILQHQREAGSGEQGAVAGTAQAGHRRD